MKRDEKMERELRIKDLFFSWCKKNNREPNGEAFVDYDETQGRKLLDYGRAKTDGPYQHLLRQADARIASWGPLEALRHNGGGSPYHAPNWRPTRVDNGVVKTREEILADPEALKRKVNDYKRKIQGETETLYFFMERRDELTNKIRKDIQQVLADAEETAFAQTRTGGAKKAS
jgi:hypothetical protein